MTSAAADESFDFMIFGAGSAGSAIAARLSECGRHTVLLLEVGGDDRWIWLRVPLGAGRALLSERSLWRFYTEPEPHMAWRKMYWPRGRVLGGSSTVNGMLLVRGEPAEYDAWRESGCPDWGYDDVLPFLKRVESYASGDPATRGTDSPVNVLQFEPDQLSACFHRACVESGILATPDYNGVQYQGVGILQTNTRRDLRQSGREAYLDPVMGRDSLTLHTGARARRIRVEQRKAVGVEYSADGHQRFARVRQEVIVAAGAVQSPHLLELSGIGDHERLAAFGIASVADLPGVGADGSLVGAVSTLWLPAHPDFPRS